MHDVIVIGAGAAGLAAGTQLVSAGLDVVVLEARERTGGRCWSVAHEASPIPLELGAEFVHGAATQTEKLAQRAGVVISDVAGDDWRPRGGRMTRQHDFWDRVGRVFKLMPRTGDMSFGEFLATQPGGKRLAQDRVLAKAFVQGFHAADIDRIGVRALADAGNPGEEESASRHGRTVHGYTALLRPLNDALAQCIRFGHIVEHVRWERGHVVVQTTQSMFEARRAVITLPLGVLLSDAVRFEPESAALRQAAEGLAVGHVARVSIVFDRRFWEDDVVPGVPAGASLSRLSFLHTPGGRFNIWWTMHPLRAPVMVGWSGGPPAQVLEAEGDVEATAIGELARELGVSRRRLSSMVVATFHHDWSADPFSRGAYSYAQVGGADAADKLSRAVQSTLYFAGEATAGDESGTVEGALKSGQRAARQVLRAEGAHER